MQQISSFRQAFGIFFAIDGILMFFLLIGKYKSYQKLSSWRFDKFVTEIENLIHMKMRNLREKSKPSEKLNLSNF